MTESINTGIILPRDYGIMIRTKDRQNIFLSPFKYVLANAFLEHPSLLKKSFEEHSISPYSIAEKVLEKEGNKNLLNLHNNKVVNRVKKYGNKITASIKSKSGRIGYYEVFMENPLMNEVLDYSGLSCNCKDFRWEEVKSHNVMCLHLSCLEQALYSDSNTGINIKSSITGLPPRKRFENPSMPFNLEVLLEEKTELLKRYYIDNAFVRTLNVELLKKQEIYSEPLKNMILKGYATFQIIRQKEQEKIVDNISEKRNIASSKLVLERSKEVLLKNGFYNNGYVINFINQNEVIISERFQNKDRVYDLSITQNIPLIIKKNLDLVSSNWISTKNMIPLEEKKIRLLKDDSTRRISYTRILKPGTEIFSQIRIPLNIKTQYWKVVKSKH